jgi:mRNA interferase RelE/StbE
VNYELLIERAAQRALQRIPQPEQDRIIEAIRGLADAPRPPGVKKLAGREAWRMRVGD